MATLNFPSDPGAQTPVNTYGPDSTPLSTSNNVTYVWDGEKWVASTQNSSDARYVNVTGDTMTGDLTVPNLISQGTVTGTNIPTNGSIVGYQQGVWTPTANLGTGTTMSGHWWRIGNTVTLQGVVAGLTDRTANGIHIWGVPYSPISFNGGFTGSMMLTQSNGAKHTVYMDTAANVLQFYQSAATNSTAWTSTTYNNLGSGNDFRFQITYLTDDTTWTPLNGATVS